MAPSRRQAKRQRVDDSSFTEQQEKLLKSLSEEAPVLSVCLKGAPPDLDVTSNDLLEQVIYPISKATFLEHSFRKKALHITGNTQSRIRSIVEELQQLDPEHILTETSSENVFVWLQQKADGKIHSLELQDPQQALALHQIGGHATYCRAPPSIEQPMVANLLRGTGFGCGQYDPSGTSSVSLGRGEVEVFIGTRAHVTQWHYDFQENFTIQLSGCKKWKLQQGTTKCPIRGCTPHYAAPEAVESQLKAVSSDFVFGNPQVGKNALHHEQEVTLQPGDVLYFPAGMWHQVTTVEPGVSINVSLMATNYAALTCQTVQHLLLQGPDRDEWQETVHSNGGDGAVVVQKLQRLLEKLPQIISDFTANYGANAVVPPVLRHAPSFQVTDQENDGWLNPNDEDEDDDKESSRDCDEEQDEIDVDETDGGEASGVDDEDTDAREDDDHAGEVLGTTVVNVAQFEPPPEWSPEKPGPNHHLAVSPLAWIRPVNDVTQFYQPTTQADQSNLYVININYAGNEMHESAVRIIVKDEQQPSDISRDNTVGPREACYLYHGFYCWTSNRDK